MYSTVPAESVSSIHHDFGHEFPTLATHADLNDHAGLIEGYATSSFHRAADSIYSDAVLTSFGSDHSTFHEYDSPLFSSATESMAVSPKIDTNDADHLVSSEAGQPMMLSPDIPVKDEWTSPPSMPMMAYHSSNASTSLDEEMFESKRSSSTPAAAGTAQASVQQSLEGVHEGTWSASDKKLVAWRRQGISYKEILELGHFKEKESTLRGRYRTLTRPAADRPRNPQWAKGDVSISIMVDFVHFPHRLISPSPQVQALLLAVERHLDTVRQNTKKSRNVGALMHKIPWAKVANDMCELGAQRRFAPKTCHKKWQQVKAREE